MTHVACRLTAKNRDQLRNPTLGNRVWATFTFIAKVMQLLPNPNTNTNRNLCNETMAVADAGHNGRWGYSRLTPNALDQGCNATIQGPQSLS